MPEFGNSCSIFCLKSCAFSSMKYKWNHPVCSIFTEHNIFEIHPCYFIGNSLFFIAEWKWKSLSLVWFFATHGLYSPWNSPGQNIGVRSLSLLQGIFLTQGLNQGLLHSRRILYQLSFKQAVKRIPWTHISWGHKNANTTKWFSYSTVGMYLI